MTRRTPPHARVAPATLAGGLSAVSAPAQRIEFVDVTRRAGLYEPLEGIMGPGAAPHHSTVGLRSCASISSRSLRGTPMSQTWSSPT